VKINHEKITKEFCQGKRLLFFPQTSEETVFIQRKLFELGYEWDDNNEWTDPSLKTKVYSVGGCISTGMVARDGKIYTDPNEESYKTGFLCTSTQFDESFVSFEQAILAQFNKLSAKVDAMYGQIMPKTLDKPVTKKPGGGPP
jgi:hypothetical protein